MSPVHIVTRTVQSGRRYLVRYRSGGRGFKLVHAGSFPTLREARLRRDLIAGEIASGRDPRVLLERLKNPPVASTVSVTQDDWISSRHDVSLRTREIYLWRSARINQDFGNQDPRAITAAQVSTWVGQLNEEYAPGTISLFVAQLRMILDFAGVEPNPARHQSVRLPRRTAEEQQPPTAAHLLALLAHIGRAWRLPLVTLEQTAMRVTELSTLEWSDVDVDGCRFRLSATDTKRSRPRWVQVPSWLMEILVGTCPLEDRGPGRRVFPRFERRAARTAMATACKLAGIPHYHPHDLRHRRTSLWHGQGVPEAELAKRVGHAKPSMTLDVYSHVMPLDEAPPARLASLVTGS